MDENKAIDFLMFTVKQNKDSIADVTIDLKAREYKIEKTDLYGQTIEPEVGGKLRRKKVGAFLDEIAQIGLLAFPQKEKNTLPIHLKNATLMYMIDGNTYYTDGDDQKNLSHLHKSIEQLTNTTFGSYEFY